MATTTVGVREFRENLATHLESQEPVAITRHGETLGHYVPAPRRRWTEADWAAFDERRARIQKMFAEAGLTEEDLMELADEASRADGHDIPKRQRPDPRIG